MSESNLANKMKLKAGSRVAVIRAPKGYLEEIGPLPDRVVITSQLDGLFDWIQVFVKSKAELDVLVSQLIAAMKPESLLWITFPKGSAKIQIDLTRDRGWESLEGADLNGSTSSR